MPDDLHTAESIVRPAMRKWWKPVVLWWGVLLLICVSWSLIEAAILKPRIESGDLSYSAYALKVALVYPLCRMISFYPGLLLVWLLAAFKVNRELSRIALGDKTPSTSEMLPIRFTLAMKQGAIPLIVFLLYHVLSTAASQVCSIFGLFQDITLDTYSVIAGVLYAIASMIWITALLAVSMKAKHLVWIWFTAAFCVPALVAWVAGILDILGVRIVWLDYEQLSALDINNELAWAVGILVMIMLLYACRYELRIFRNVLFGFVVLISVLGVDLIMKPCLQICSSGSTVWAMVLVSIRALGRTWAFFPAYLSPVVDSNAPPTAAKLWLLYPAFQPVEGTLGVIALLTLLINVCWLILLYAVIRYIVLQRPAENPR